MAVELVYDKEIMMTEERKRAVLICCCVVLVAVFCCVLALAASVVDAADSPLPTPTMTLEEACIDCSTQSGWGLCGYEECFRICSLAVEPTLSSPLPTVASPLSTPIIPDQSGPLSTPTVNYREDCDLCLRLVQSGLVGAWECLHACDDNGLPPTECGIDLITDIGEACYGY